MFECPCCEKKLKNQRYADTHMKNHPLCMYYDKLALTCKNCGTNLLLKEISRHFETCVHKIIPSTPVEQKLRQHDEKISTMQEQIMKNTQLCTAILAKLTNVDTETVIEGSEPTPKPHKKKIYRKIQGQTKVVKENPEIRQEKVKKVEDTIEQIQNEKFVGNKEVILESLEKLFSEIDSRTYSKKLKEIKNRRINLIGLISLEEYITLLSNHCQQLIDIFKKRNFIESKLKKTVSKAFTALDLRLIFYNGYYNTTINRDDLDNLKLALKITTNHPKEYYPFNIEKIHKRLQNYSLALFSVEECLKRVLFNIYGFNSIVYVMLDKSTKDDPYSFYILEKVVNNVRNWKLELRLEDISYTISNIIKNYCIYLFRRIYKDVFNDNEYREDYQCHSLILQTDCKQLLATLSKLIFPSSFRNILKKLVMENASIHPTADYDKFHLTSDDITQKKRLKQEKETDKESIIIAEQLFDTISAKQSVELWQDVS